MKRPHTLWLAGVLCALVPVASLSVWAADQPGRPAAPPAGVRVGDATGPRKTTPKPDAEPKAEDEQELLKSFQRLEVLSAEAYVKLTELDLQKIMQMNEKMAGVYSNAEVDNLKGAVEIAKERVRVAREQLEGRNESHLVGIALIRLKNAQQVYERALTANRRLATTYGPIDIERLKMAVESARIDADKARVVAKLDSPITDLHLEFDQLREEVRQLRYRVTSITSRR